MADIGQSDLLRRVIELEKKVRYNQQRVPQLLAVKRGSNNGTDYTSTSTTPVAVDAANLNFAYVVPSGWYGVAFCSISAFRADTLADQIEIRLTDVSTGKFCRMFTTQPVGSYNDAGMMHLITTGDDQTHQFELQYFNDTAARTVRIFNGTNEVIISYWLYPNLL